MNIIQNLNFTVEYANQILSQIPYGYIDKTICGCGLTTVALENNRNSIIAVPSTELIENKVSQYSSKDSKISVFGVLGGVNTNDIDNWINNHKDQPIKIMVTYDSLHKVEFLFPYCDIIIDESNELLTSSELKISSKKTTKDEDVITKLFKLISSYKEKVSFISATPVPVDLFPKWVGELPQIKMNWSNTIKATPYLMERSYPFKALNNEIIKPLQEQSEVKVGDIIVKKAIIFINSVTNIMKIIKDNNLKVEDVAIMCGKSVKNDVAIKGYNRLTNPKQLPKYTFITSSGFAGIDLYDNEAVNVVVSSTSKEHQLIDMMTDLKQAISRQRNKNNPNYGKYIYIFNTSIFSKTEEQLINQIDTIAKNIKQSISLYELAKTSDNKDGFEFLTNTSKDFIYYTNYCEDTDTYIMNDIAFAADRYFILTIRKQYTEGFNLRGNFEEYTEIESVELPKEVSYTDLVEYYLTIEDKTNPVDWGVYSTKLDWIYIIETCQRLYSKVWKNITLAKQMIDNYTDPYGQIAILVKSAFSKGNRYTRAEVKDYFRKLYIEQNIKRTPKHSDLFEFFEVRELVIQGERMIEILKRK